MRFELATGTVLIATLCAGCASVVNDSHQALKIEAKTADGQFVVGAECRLANDYGVVQAKSGETAQIHRSASDLDITCRQPGLPGAYARAVSRANGGMWGNIALGGGIGALVDHNKGNAYSYPEWVQVVFGESLIFDKSKDETGTPATATNTRKQ